MSKIGNKYIFEIESEALINNEMKYWIKGFNNMCVDDYVLDKLQEYHGEPDTVAGDVVTLGENGTCEYLVLAVEYQNGNNILHLMNSNNGYVRTYTGKYKKINSIIKKEIPNE